MFASEIWIAPDAEPVNVSGFSSTVPAAGADSIPCSETGLTKSPALQTGGSMQHSVICVLISSGGNCVLRTQWSGYIGMTWQAHLRRMAVAISRCCCNNVLKGVS